MGTITTQAILVQCGQQLQDIGADRWTEDMLLGFLSEAQRAVVLLKPSAYVVNASVKLVAGTRQSLPAAAVQLLDVVRNMGANSATPGRAVRRIEREILDTQVPGWHKARAAAEIKHFASDVTNLKNFYVYPPANGATYIEAVYSTTPPNATSGGVIALDDIYQPALVNYTMYRAMQIEADYAADPARAGAYLSAFTGAVTGKTAVELARNPNRDTEANPNSRAPRS